MKTDVEIEELKRLELEEFKASLYKLSRRSLRRGFTTSKFTNVIQRQMRDQNLS